MLPHIRRGWGGNATALILGCMAKERARVIPFEPAWDTGAPMPTLLAGMDTALAFYAHPQAGVGDDEVVVVRFDQCIGARIGPPAEESMNGHPLSGKGLSHYSAHVIQNSSWVADLEAIDRLHPYFKPGFAAQFRHYFFAFHDESVEVVAAGFTVERRQGTVPQVVASLARDLRA
jgi:hypothetical protein